MIKICDKANADAFKDDWKLPTAALDEVSYLKIKDTLFSLTDGIEKSGDEPLAHGVALIAHVCGMGLQMKEPDTPFVALATWADGSRTAIPDDLTDVHLATLKRVAGLVSNFAIRARIFDILWLKVRPKKKEYAEKAIENYRKLAAQVRDKHIKEVTYSCNYLSRAIQLWRQIGADTAIRTQLENEVVACMMLDKEEPRNAIRFHFFNLIPSIMESADVQKWAKLGEEFAQKSLEQKNYEKARAYTETVRLVFRVAKDDASAKIQKEKHTELFVSEAKEMKDAKADPMILQTLYNKAIEACRNTPGKAGLAKELHTELVEIQKQIPGNLKQVSDSIDLKPAIEQTIDAIRQQNFLNSLKIVALKARPQKKTTLFSEAEKLMKEFPLQSLITTVILDEKGKVVAQRPGMGSTPEEKVAAIRSRASQNLVMNFEITGVVLEWAQREIDNRTDFDSSVIDSILYPNPFVPLSRREQFKAGIVRGLKGDWISSISILIPQLENSLRHVMQLAGNNMVIIDSEGAQKEKDLNAFIYNEEFGQLVGEDMQFQLQVLLCDKTGLNLRNNVAHGLLTDGGALSGSSAYVWALTLLLCMDFQARYYSANVQPHATEMNEEGE